MSEKKQMTEEKIWGVYNTFENPEILETISEIDLYKSIYDISGAMFWTEHDAGKPWAYKPSKEELTNAQYNLDFLVYSTKKFGVKFSKEPSSSEPIERSESYSAWFRFWNNHFESMKQEVYDQFIEDKNSGKDISKYMPKDTWQDYYKKSVFDKVFGKYKFKQLNDFTEQVCAEIDELVNVENKKLCTEWTIINARLKNGLNLKILIKYQEEMDWITFYIKNDFINLEQVQFMFFKNNEKDFNKIVSHDYFTVEDNIATTFNSSYTYVDDEYKDGFEQERKVPYNNIESYAGKDNLANFAFIIDSNKDKVLYKNDKKNLENPEINPVFLRNENDSLNKIDDLSEEDSILIKKIK